MKVTAPSLLAALTIRDDAPAAGSARLLIEPIAPIRYGPRLSGTKTSTRCFARLEQTSPSKKCKGQGLAAAAHGLTIQGGPTKAPPADCASAAVSRGFRPYRSPTRRLAKIDSATGKIVKGKLYEPAYLKRQVMCDLFPFNAIHAGAMSSQRAKASLTLQRAACAGGSARRWSRSGLVASFAPGAKPRSTRADSKAFRGIKGCLPALRDPSIYSTVPWSPGWSRCAVLRTATDGREAETTQRIACTEGPCSRAAGSLWTQGSLTAARFE